MHEFLHYFSVTGKIQRYGRILKRETLSTASVSFHFKDLILTSSDPFPGFYCAEDMPADNSCKENSFYLPIQHIPEQEDKLCRLSLEIQAIKSMDICPARIMLEKVPVPAVRVKGIESGKLPDVFDYLNERGIQFFKRREIKSYLSRIQLRDFFELKEIEDGIFRNRTSPNLHYLIIPEELSWEVFERIITFQKSRTGFKNFDAAIGYWMQKPHLIDFIRVYGVRLTLEQLREIHQNFLKNLEDFMHKRIMI